MPHCYVGKRVFVVWNAWEPYIGTITKYDPFKNNPFFVEYDDGEKQWEAAEDVRPIGAFNRHVDARLSISFILVHLRLALATHKCDAIKLLCAQILVRRALLVNPASAAATADLCDLLRNVVVPTGATHRLVRDCINLVGAAAL